MNILKLESVVTNICWNFDIINIQEAASGSILGYFSRGPADVAAGSTAESDERTEPLDGPSTSAASSSGVPNLSHFKKPPEVLNAEIIWALRTVFNHDSLRSAEGLKDYFSAMFPDSKIAMAMEL